MKTTIQFWPVISCEGAYVTMQTPEHKKRDILKADFPEQLAVGNIAVMKKHRDGSFSPIGMLSSRKFYEYPHEMKKLKTLLA